MHLAAALGLAAALAVAAPAGASVPPDTVEVETPVHEVAEPVRRPPERWIYSFSWGRFVKVGEVEITAGERVVAGDSRPGREIGVSVRAETSTVLDWIWRYRMNADGVVHLDPFRPSAFEIRESIKRGPKTMWVKFDGNGGVHTYRNKKGQVREFSFQAPNAFDLASTVLLLLHQELTVGETYQIDTLAGIQRYLITVEVVGREDIEAAGREHAALRLKVLSRDLTDPPDTEKHQHTDLWVSAEQPRRLLQAVSHLWVGAVRGRLERVEKAPDWPRPPAEVDLDIEAQWLGFMDGPPDPSKAGDVPRIVPDEEKSHSAPLRPR